MEVYKTVNKKDDPFWIRPRKVYLDQQPVLCREDTETGILHTARAWNNLLKLFDRRFRTDKTKYFYISYIVHLWNSLLQEVEMAFYYGFMEPSCLETVYLHVLVARGRTGRKTTLRSLLPSPHPS